MEDGDKRDKRKVILRGMEARKSMEINFDFDQWRRREGKGDRSFQSDFINEMEQDRGTGRAGSHGHPVLGSLKSHPCDFSLAFRPFHK